MYGKKKNHVTPTYDMLQTSWKVQGKLFFEHSTLHGVRYIAETERPFVERFMWFTCVAVGTIATSVIIFNLWEKFQTNPTITGLDTDFHNWEVAFPAITICQHVPTTPEKIEYFIWEQYGRNETTSEDIQFFTALTQMSISTILDFQTNYSKQTYLIPDTDLKDTVFKLVNTCEDVFEYCYFKSYRYNCCDGFFPVFTETGVCYSFNSRHYEENIPGRAQKLPEFNMQYIQETDIKWSLQFKVRSDASYFSIYILNSDEIPGLDTQPQHIWDFRMETIMFSVKQTYTTLDTKQLSIKQRRCAFPDEIKLKGEQIYSYTACTRECRMKNAMKLCNCVPFFYPVKSSSFIHCKIGELACITKNLNEIKALDKCSCYLGCSNTVYEVEKLDAGGQMHDNALDCKFLSWPMVRYKREVLFGWVDLLVSFGGIAGLFLGFSLLSGVELVYYFTLRACCMVLRQGDELRKIQLQDKLKPLPEYDLSLVPYFISKPLPGGGINEVAKNFRNGELKRFPQKIYPMKRLHRPADVIIAPFGIEFLN